MLLMDQVAQWHDSRAARPEWSPYAPAMREITRDIRAAVRFRLEPAVLELAAGLAGDEPRLLAAAPFLFLPAPRAWFEWREGESACAFLLQGRDDPDKPAQAGMGTMFTPAFIDEGDSTGIVDREAWFSNVLDFDLTAVPPRVAFRPEYHESARAEGWALDDRATLRLILAVLAVLNSPKAARFVNVGRGKINKGRLLKGRYALLDHKEVRINIDRPPMEHPRANETNSMPLHFVRAYARIRSGQVELIRQHWKGNPAMGIIRPRYRLHRK